jgi:hypothetical protein
MAARVYPIACTACVCMKNICSTDIRVVVGATAGVPHLVGLAALARYASHLSTYCQTSMEGIHTSELISKSFSIRKGT